MNDTVVLSVVTLIYLASSSGLVFLNTHYLIPEERIRQIINLPLVRLRDEDINTILETYKKVMEASTLPAGGQINATDSQLKVIGNAYDNISLRHEETAELLKWRRYLLWIRSINLLNMVFSFLVILYIVYCLLSGCSGNKLSTLNIIMSNIRMFAILIVAPWIIFIVTFCASKLIEGLISKKMNARDR